MTGPTKLRLMSATDKARFGPLHSRRTFAEDRKLAQTNTSTLDTSPNLSQQLEYLPMVIARSLRWLAVETVGTTPCVYHCHTRRLHVYVHSDLSKSKFIPACSAIGANVRDVRWFG